MKLCFTLFAFVLLTGCGQQSSPNQFESIRQIVCEGRYAEAIPKLEAYDGRHRSRAGLFLSKAQMGLGDMNKARQVFDDTIRNCPDSLEAHKCRYKLALLSMLQGNAQSAKKQFFALSTKPNGPLAAESRAMAEFIQ